MKMLILKLLQEFNVHQYIYVLHPPTAQIGYFADGVNVGKMEYITLINF